MKKKTVFIEGQIPPQFIANTIASQQTTTKIGAHNIFLGQVRKDIVEEKTVTAINFTAYEDMAEEKIEEIREEGFQKFNLTDIHIYHSTGNVNLGEVCFFVFVSAPHRPNVYKATEHIVNRIKREVPIFGKEIFEDASYQWKTNTQW